MPAGSVAKRRLVEHPAERRHGQVQVAVLLHVEVDEHGRLLPCSDVVDGRETLGDARRPRGRTRARRGWRTAPRSSPTRSRRRAGAIRAHSASRRAAASSSPRIASPSRLTLTSKPAAARRRTWRANAGSAAGTITPRVSARMRRRTIAATGRGASDDPAAASAQRQAVEQRQRCRQPGADEVGAAAPSSGSAPGVRSTSSVSANSSSRPAVVAEQAAEPSRPAPLLPGRRPAGVDEQLLGPRDGGGDDWVLVGHAPIEAHEPRRHDVSRPDTVPGLRFAPADQGAVRPSDDDRTAPTVRPRVPAVG